LSHFKGKLFQNVRQLHGRMLNSVETPVTPEDVDWMISLLTSSL